VAYPHTRLFATGALFAAAAFLVVPLAIGWSVSEYTFVTPDAAPTTDVAIVLGASVVRGAPSPVLAARADGAVALYLKGKVSKILVTGDSGALTHDEVTPVRKYLLASGIPAEDIFLDHSGFDTYSSMYRARYVFGVRSATVVTQRFHMPRALYIARSLGIAAVGVVAGGSAGGVYEYVREIPASWKALFDIAMRRAPKYLGPTIPIEGDG